MIPFSPLHKKYLTVLGLVSLIALGSWLAWHISFQLISLIDRIFASYIAFSEQNGSLSPVTTLLGLWLLSPLIALAGGLQALVGTVVLAPFLGVGAGMLFGLVWLYTRLFPHRYAAWLVRSREQEAHRLARLYNRPVPQRPVVVLPHPWTPAQQTRYNDMRAKGWSELAAQQAAERLGS